MVMFRLVGKGIVAAILIASGSAIAEDIFLQSQSPASRRYAILEDDGQTAYLYLTKPNELTPVRDAVAYTRVPPVAKVDWESIRKTGDTPRLPVDLASPSAVIQSPKPSEFQFKWSGDGHSVAILHNGSPLAMAGNQDRFGYSKAVKKASPLANAWDEKRYLQLFGR